MANNSGDTNYPTSLDDFPEKVANVDEIKAADINSLQDAIEAIEAVIGTDGDYNFSETAGIFTDLDDVPDSYTGEALKLLRVNAIEDAVEFYDFTLAMDGLSDVSAASPSSNDILYYDGTSWTTKDNNAYLDEEQSWTASQTFNTDTTIEDDTNLYFGTETRKYYAALNTTKDALWIRPTETLTTTNDPYGLWLGDAGNGSPILGPTVVDTSPKTILGLTNQVAAITEMKVNHKLRFSPNFSTVDSGGNLNATTMGAELSFQSENASLWGSQLTFENQNASPGTRAIFLHMPDTAYGFNGGLYTQLSTDGSVCDWSILMTNANSAVRFGNSDWATGISSPYFIIDSGGIYVDTITEATADNGIDIESVNLKDGNIHLSDNSTLNLGTGDDASLDYNSANDYVELLGKKLQLGTGSKVEKCVSIDIGAFKAPGVNPADLEEVGIGFAYCFDDTTEQSISASIHIPEDMDRSVAPTLKADWAAAATTGTAVWQVEYLYVKNGEAIDGAAQETLSETATPDATTSYGKVTTEMTGVDTPEATDDIIIMRISRLPGDASDDMTGDALIKEIKFCYTADKLGE